jgi:hypothetical protein
LPQLRRDAFVKGLKACGYFVNAVFWSPSMPVRAGDVLVIWNRYANEEQLANQFEKAGGRVIVAENGYIGQGGSVPKWDAKHVGPGQYYAMALHGHNGAGTWPAGDGSRWAGLGINVKDYGHSATHGKHVLVCANRSFGMRGMAMPQGWADDVANRLRRHTSRPIRVRHHPGNTLPAVPLEADLKDAWACVIWASGAGLTALIHGVPVICEAPHWICKSATGHDVSSIEHPRWGDRLPAFERLAWAQWRIDEIASGQAFRHLLNPDS